MMAAGLGTLPRLLVTTVLDFMIGASGIWVRHGRVARANLSTPSAEGAVPSRQV